MWKPWEAAVVGFLGLVAGVILGGLLAAPIDERNEPLQFALLGIGFEAGLGGTVLLWLRGLHRASFRALEFHPRRWRDAFRGAAAGIVVYIAAVFGVAFVLVNVLSAFTSDQVGTPDQLPQDAGSATAIAVTCVFVLIGAPLAEELFFRGFLFRTLRARWRFLPAALVSGAAFGLAHYDVESAWHDALLLAGVMVFVGVALAYVFERFRNLLASMAAHAVFNATGLIFILSFNT